VIDVTKHQGLASLPGFPFEVRTTASTREQAGIVERTAVNMTMVMVAPARPIAVLAR
jgi:hypothetical protein